MAMAESNLLKRIQKRCSPLGARLFRQNTGMAWQGKELKYKPGHMYKITGDEIILKHPRRIHMGLIEGSSDLVGVTPIIITQEMVGSTIGVMTVFEGKTGDLQATDKQDNFIHQMDKIGCIAAVIRHEDEAEEIIMRRQGK